MLNEVLDDPRLSEYLTTYKNGQTIFLEGDDSHDLYILVSGKLGIFKGNTEITHISEPGSIFGEMSFILRSTRTASVKAENDVQALCIPENQISTIINDYPEIAREITSALAQRLDETSRAVYGLKEACENLPDAVIMTDAEGKIITWNRVAEDLYGRESAHFHEANLSDLYEDQESFKEFQQEVQTKFSVREEILRINHPEKGIRYLSVSATALYDGHYNYQGILSQGRDVTSMRVLQKRNRWIRMMLVPLFLLLGFLAVAVFLGYPYFFEGIQAASTQEANLMNRLKRDSLLLKSLLVSHLEAGDKEKTVQLMENFFQIQDTSTLPYTGLVILDGEKMVLNAYSLKEGREALEAVGSTYANIEFEGNSGLPHRVLTLYRTDKEHPTGSKGIEIAFEMKRKNQPMGWLLFQMDLAFFDKENGINIEDLKNYEFKEP